MRKKKTADLRRVMRKYSLLRETLQSDFGKSSVTVQITYSEMLHDCSKAFLVNGTLR